jgi:D-alanyl-D-alanine carboxypeptidase/D-alanyl-D-alanine-endopeptidase (penicillin-binding protein 4)
VTPIVVNDNLIDLTIVPALPGERAKVAWRPQTSCVRVDAIVETVAEDQPLTTAFAASESGTIVLRGQIPAGHRPLVRVHEVPDAAAFARALFIESLREAGVDVRASPLTPPRAGASLPDRNEYARWNQVARLVSPPFSESARLILKVSHNLHASALPLLVAARRGERTLAAGLKRQHDFLIRAGVEADTISFGGGAGGSAADFVTPRATVQLLRAMRQRPDAEIYRRALPVLGVDGTLAEAVAANSPARGKFSAKTGTLYRENVMNGTTLLTSKALAGYGTTGGGRAVAFAIFVNNVHLPHSSETAKIGKVLGRVCEVIYATE